MTSENLTNGGFEAYGALDQFLLENVIYFEITLYVLYPLISILGVIGNTLVIYVLMSSIFVDRKFQAMQNVNNIASAAATPAAAALNRKPSNHENQPAQAAATTSSPAQRATAELDGIVNNNNNNNHRPSLFTRHTPSPSLATRSSSSLKKIVREKLSVTNFYLLNLAMCDLLYVLSIPTLVCTIYFGRWHFNLAFCKIYFSQIYLCQCSIVFILVVLSIDRYLSVKYPHKVNQFRSDQVARAIITCSWLLSFVVILPVPIYAKIDYLPNEATGEITPTCSMHYPETWPFANNAQTSLTNFLDNYLSPAQAFNAYTLVLNYLLPVIIIVILYTGILNKLHGKNVSSAIRRSKLRKKSHRKITKMVLTIIICYIGCWTPYWFLQMFLYLYLHVFKQSPRPLFMILSNLFQVLCYMSSMLNPFIYSYMSEAFKLDLHRAVSHFSCCVSIMGYFERRRNSHHATADDPPPVVLMSSRESSEKEKKAATATAAAAVAAAAATQKPKSQTSAKEEVACAKQLLTSNYLRSKGKVIVFDEELENLNSIQKIEEEDPEPTRAAGANHLTTEAGDERRMTFKLSSLTSEIDHLNSFDSISTNTANNSHVQRHPRADGKKLSSTTSIRKLVVKSSKNLEFEIKFHGLSRNSSGKFLNRIFSSSGSNDVKK